MIDNGTNGLHALGRVDLNNIKTGLKLRWMLGKVHFRRSADTILLGYIHEFVSLGEFVRLSQLDLHKNQMGLTGNDQIDLTVAAAVSGSNQLIAFFAQIFRRYGFTPGTGYIISSHRASSKRSFGGSGWGLWPG